jgi:hypothetical protein
MIKLYKLYSVLLLVKDKIELKNIFKGIDIWYSFWKRQAALSNCFCC